MIIPVEISHFALSEGKEYPIHCFHLLKHVTPGHTYLNKRQISVLSAYLNRSNRTVRRYLQYLEGIGWIEPNGKVHVIKSWKKVFHQMGFRYVIGVEINPKIIKNPRAFFAGVVLGRLTNFQKYKRNSTGKGKTAISSHGGSARPGYSNYFPVADRALASILEISRSKANKLKKLAKLHGYIELKYNFYPYELNGNFIKIDNLDKHLFRKIFEDVGHKMRIDKAGRVTVQDSDLVRANLKYKKSWNYL
ncbi:hypothetical protein [Rhodohalobacter sulfatireducens]|nr:hypothetical protein [Rhodohalobacter sulfatireducens]